MNNPLISFPISSPYSLLICPARQLSLGTIILALAASLAFTSVTWANTSETETKNRGRIAEFYGKSPMSFEANRGQTDAQVKFLSRGPGYSLFLTSTEAVLTLRKVEPKPAVKFKPVIVKEAAPLKPATATVLRMQLQGANARAQVIGLDELPGKTNYLRGKDPKAWRTGIPSFAKVKYSSVYPGIDLIYYGNQRQLEYDFVVAPGADPKTIRLRFDGAEQLSLDANGQLVVKTAGGEVIQHKPVIYQEIGGVRKAIDGGYALYPDKKGTTSQIGFQVAQYDSSKALTIDPVLGYSTYLGGSGDDFSFDYDISVDHSGNAYVTGSTDSADFPIVNAEPLGNAGAFVTKFNPKGGVIFSTLLGGGSDGAGIAVDSRNNVYLTGATTSSDFPILNPVEYCSPEPLASSFVTKLSSDGASILYSTCIGFGTFGQAIAVDRYESAYVTGLVSIFSTHFPTVNALQPTYGGSGTDAFVLKLNPAGNALVYSTYLGGGDPLSEGNYDEEGSDIAVDRFGNAYVTGTTASANFPTQNAFQPVYGGGVLDPTDTFVAKINASGSALLYSTYLGGNEADGNDSSIAVDVSGNAYVTGGTGSENFPTLNPLKSCAGSDAFITKFTSAGGVVYSTCLGGSEYEAGSGIALDRYGNVYTTGYTFSTDFPKVRPVRPACDGVNGDAYVNKLNASGTALIYSTCIGGSDREVGHGIAVDRFGNAYITGETRSEDLPTFKAIQPKLGGGTQDAFVTKITGN